LSMAVCSVRRDAWLGGPVLLCSALGVLAALWLLVFCCGLLHAQGTACLFALCSNGEGHPINRKGAKRRRGDK